MAENHPDETEVLHLAQQIRRECMAEGVRADPVGLVDLCLPRKSLQHYPHIVNLHPVAVAGREQIQAFGSSPQLRADFVPQLIAAHH